MAQITSAMVKELRDITSSPMMDCKKALVDSNGDMEAAKEILRKKGQLIANKKAGREAKEGAISIFLNDDFKKAALVKVACETDFVAINQKFKDFIAGLAKQAVEVGADNFTEKATSEGPVKEQITNAIAELGENIIYQDGESWDASENSLIGSYTHSNGKIGVMVELGVSSPDKKEEIFTLAKDISMHIAASQVEAIKEEDLDPSIVEKEKAFLIDQAKDSGKPQEIIEKMVIGRLQKFKKEICLMEQPFVKNPDQSIKKLLAESGKQLGVELEVKRFYKSQF